MPPRRTVADVTSDLDAMRQLMERQFEETRRRDERHAEDLRRRDEQLQQQANLVNRLMEHLGQQGAGPPQPVEGQIPIGGNPQDPVEQENPNLIPPTPNPLPIPVVAEPVYERFRRQQPLTFKGTADPSVAEDWIKRIQRIFIFMRLNDEERIACAVNQLEKGASYWWDLVAQTEDMAALTWTDFVKRFNDKYLGEAIRTRKIQEFMALRQGKLLVAEYVTKFEELARFAPTIVPTDEARKTKFMHGLRVDIVKQVDSGATGPQSYSEAVQRALRLG